MKTLTKSFSKPPRILKQRGVVLFFALIALLAISLAAVALIRSVDTGTMIAGNLAFKQSATSSADGGVEVAMTFLTTTAAANLTRNILTDPTNFLNSDHAGNGYYSSLDPLLNLTDSTAAHSIKWNNSDSALAGTDASGNVTRIVIQRMCRNANVAIQNADCLFSSAIQDSNGQAILLPQDVCSGPGCPVAGQAPQIRITAKTAAPRNSVSYVQAFVY